MNLPELCRALARESRRHREENGLTQADMADRCGFSSRYLRDIEAGRCDGLSLKNAAALLAECNKELELTPAKPRAKTELEKKYDVAFDSILDEIESLSTW